MASTFSDLKIELMATGENSGTWGDVTNVNLGTALEEAITGSANVAFSSADVTLTLSNVNTTQPARNLRLNLTGTSGGNRSLIVPAIEKIYIINNGLANQVTVKNATGTGIAVPAGKTMYVYNNGTNVVDAITHLTSLTLGSALPVASGGTGITSFGAGIATFLSTPTSANLAAAVTNETGTGALVFASSPALAGIPTTPTAAAGTNTTQVASTAHVFAERTNTATLTNKTLTSPVVSGGTINNASVGASTASTGSFTNFVASGTAQFTSTGAVTVAKGTTAQRPASPQAGDFRFNTQTSEFEGFNGSAFASVGGAGLANDTTTTTDVFPLFADATTGTASSLFTSNAKLLYKPSTGEFKSQALVATNGIVVNSATIDTNYTIPTGSNAMSAGPVEIASGVEVAVANGSTWTVV